MCKRFILRRIISLSIVILLAFIVLFPNHAFFTLLGLFSLPQNFPLGIQSKQKIESNFQKHRSELEAIVTTVRATKIEGAKLKYFGLSGTLLPSSPSVNQQNLYRSMRRAHIQRIQVTSHDPLIIQLVTDEALSLLGVDTNTSGYIYVENDGDKSRYYYGRRNRLGTNWYMFKTDF